MWVPARYSIWPSYARQAGETVRSGWGNDHGEVMASIGKGWRSIERTLPLLILCLQIATVAALTIAAYQRVEQILLVTAGQRLENASKSVVLLLEQSTARSKAVLAQVAADSALRTYLVTGRGAHAARAALATAWTGEAHPHGLELRRADGTVALDTSLGPVPAGSGWLDRDDCVGKTWLGYNGSWALPNGWRFDHVRNGRVDLSQVGTGGSPAHVRAVGLRCRSTLSLDYERPGGT